MAIEFINPQDGQDATVLVTMVDSSGDLVTGLTASNLTAYYWRPLDSGGTAITLSDLAGPDSAHSDGGVAEIDATNMPGLYRLDLPDAVIAGGENFAALTVDGGANADRIYGILLLDPYPSVVRGSVSDASATATGFDTDLSEAEDDQFIDAFLLFVTGTNAGAVEKITDYDGTNKTITCDAFPSAPADGDTFVIVNR